MSRLRSLCRLFLSVCLCFFGMGACTYLVVPMQALATARVVLSGRLTAPLERPVTLTVKPPHGLGLSASERDAGWPSLNEKHQAEVVISDQTFEVTIPVTYCIHRFMWQSELPPPPAAFFLHFSDAPGETYTIWATTKASSSKVFDESVGPMREDVANWRLTPGLLTKAGSGRDTKWVIDLEVARQTR